MLDARRGQAQNENTKQGTSKAKLKHPSGPFFPYSHCSLDARRPTPDADKRMAKNQSIKTDAMPKTIPPVSSFAIVAAVSKSVTFPKKGGTLRIRSPNQSDCIYENTYPDSLSVDRVYLPGPASHFR